MSKKVSEEMNKKILSMFKNGYSAFFISKEYGVTDVYVKKLVEQNGLTVEKSPAREQSRLVASEMVKEYESGISAEELAEKYGRSVGSIKNTLRSKIGDEKVPKTYTRKSLEPEVEEFDVEIPEIKQKKLSDMPIEFAEGVKYRVVNDLIFGL